MGISAAVFYTHLLCSVRCDHTHQRLQTCWPQSQGQGHYHVSTHYQQLLVGGYQLYTHHRDRVRIGVRVGLAD